MVHTPPIVQTAPLRRKLLPDESTTIMVPCPLDAAERALASTHLPYPVKAGGGGGGGGIGCQTSVIFRFAILVAMVCLNASAFTKELSGRAAIV